MPSRLQLLRFRMRPMRTFVIRNTSLLVAAIIVIDLTPVLSDERPPEPAPQLIFDKSMPTVEPPRLLAMTWVESTDRDQSMGNVTVWNREGKELLPDEAKIIRTEVGGTEIMQWRPESQSRPLVFLFDTGEDLSVNTVVQATCRLPSGLVVTTSSSLGLKPGRLDSDRRYSRAACSIPYRRKQKIEWPERLDVLLRYPLEQQRLVQLLVEPPPVPLQISEGLTWSVETVDEVNQGNRNETNPPRLAGVLRRKHGHRDPLVDYGVSVFVEGRDKPLGTQSVRLETIEGQAYVVSTSHSFASPGDIERIEVTRQRFAEKTIRDVAVRPDLMPEL